MKPPRFTLRDWFWLVLVVGMIFTVGYYLSHAIAVHHRHYAGEIALRDLAAGNATNTVVRIDAQGQTLSAKELELFVTTLQRANKRKPLTGNAETGNKTSSRRFTITFEGGISSSVVVYSDGEMVSFVNDPWNDTEVVQYWCDSDPDIHDLVDGDD